MALPRSQEEIQYWVSESRFRYAPMIDQFDVTLWLSTHAPSVAECPIVVDGTPYPFGEGIRAVAEESGVDTRVLIVFADIEQSLLGEGPTDCAKFAQYGDLLAELADKMMQATFFFRFGGGEVTGYTLTRLAKVVNDASLAIAEGAAIAASRLGTSPGRVESRFYTTYAALFGDPRTQDPRLVEALSETPPVSFRMPFAGSGYYTGGPHNRRPSTATKDTPPCTLIPVAEASGLDFQSATYDLVVAIADGGIVGIKSEYKDGDGGRWVAVRHDNGIVSMYWHLQEIASYLKPGMRVRSGTPLGLKGNTGMHDGKPHIHVELRRGGYNYNTWAGVGEAVSWDDRVIDGWRIFAERTYTSGEGPEAINYNGTAVRVESSVQNSVIKINCEDVKQAEATVEGGFPYDTEKNTKSTLFAQTSWISEFKSSQPIMCFEPLTQADVALAGIQSAIPCTDLGGVDHATFVADLSLPDGTNVSPGEALTKVWRVRNSGTTTWDGYSLVFLHGDQMSGSNSVPIPTTAPNQDVEISVSLRAPTTEGLAAGYWQIVNREGVHVPGGQLWVKVNVVTSTSGDHIVSFSADPLSPSNASVVNLRARINWWPQFRAMRVLVDNQVIGETAASEQTFVWNAGEFGTGKHTVVLEVADQSDLLWSRPERRVLTYELQGVPGPINHAPYRPAPVSPYDWYVYYSGDTVELCAQNQGDPDGDTVVAYYFEIYESPQAWNSGWVSNNCVTTSPLGPYTYKWRVKVRDDQGEESDWSDTWHFTIVDPNLEVSELYFEPLDPDSEQVRVRACITGQGGVGITLRVSVNDATDGSDNGQWHIIKELGVPCFNEIDAPIWNTLEYGDGSHRVRVEAHGVDSSWDGAAVREEVYVLPHRRPPSSRLLAPVSASGDIGEPIYTNSRTITFRWERVIRAEGYTLHISTSPSPKDDASPIFRQSLGQDATEHTVTLDGDYPTLYWQVTTSNDVGVNASGAQRFGIDRAAPSCVVQPLPDRTYESVFQVGWGGSDSLSGIRTFDVQYRDSERGTWADWKTNVPGSRTSDLFIGQPGHTYAFRCRATDFAGNTGAYPAVPDTSIMVDPASRPTTVWWNDAYTLKRNIVILNNMAGVDIPLGYPVHLHFDGNTNPTAAEIYDASVSSPKCDDLRIVYNDTIELDRVVTSCSSSAIDVWFRTQVMIPSGTSDSVSHQLYYGNPAPGTPPGTPSTVFDPPRDPFTVGLWYMNEGSGTVVVDHSGYNNNCVVDPTTTWVNPSKFPSALHFLGGTDGPTVDCGSSFLFNLQVFTFELFLRRTGTAWGRLAGHLGNNQNRWLMAFDGSGRVRVSIWPCPTCGSQEFLSTRAIADENWHHVGFSLEDSNLKIYVDGLLDSTHQVTDGNITSSTPPLTVGSAEAIQRAFAEIAHVRLSNIARQTFTYGANAAITSEPTLAAGTLITQSEVGAPDLEVVSVATSPDASGGVLVLATIENQGNVPTVNGFFTDLYVNHLPSGAGDLTGSLRYWVAAPIDAGERLTLTTLIDDPAELGVTSNARNPSSAETSAALHVQVDSLGTVDESDEDNNVFAAVPVCIAEGDAFEGDNSISSARPFVIGEVQRRNHHVPGDHDWVKFSARAGASYIIRSVNLGEFADTYIYLYDKDGTTVLASNDDFDATLASRIEWTAPASGTYYVLVRQGNPYANGCGTGYDLEISTTSIFNDVPSDYWARAWIERIYSAGLTSGCAVSPPRYCPSDPVSRAQMAVFLKKGIHGGDYSPPSPNASHPFSDIAGHWAEAWIEDLFDEGMTSGYPDGTYRPGNSVTRAEMAVFLLKAKYGLSYVPPAPDGSAPFSDVGGHWAEAWIEQLYDEGVTSGYPDGTYRPNSPVTRAEMAVFLVGAFNLP